MKKLVFGTAGIPLSTASSGTENGIWRVKELGLGGMELEFVRSINITKERAPGVKKVAKENDVLLTCHAPYFINLNAKEKAKLEASKARILDSARIAHLCGAWSVCFHAAFYMKQEPAMVYEKVKKQVKGIVETLKAEGNDIWVRPETTGKGSQFGNLEEVLKLSAEVPRVMPCIDFPHLHARSGGRMNSYGEFRQILDKVENALGEEGLENMHIHTSGIEYSDKGERRHLNLEGSDMNYRDLLKVWKEYKVKGIIISESANIEGDAMLLRDTYAGI
jgi:deoxyribonuclease-4